MLLRCLVVCVLAWVAGPRLPALAARSTAVLLGESPHGTHASYTWRDRRHKYVPTRLAQRYDAFVLLPNTRALQPLHAQ